MATTEPHHGEHVFGGLEKSLERALGADMTLLYGLAAPVLMVVGLIVLLGLSPATWLVISILVIEVGCLGVVLTGIFGLLNDDEDDPAS